MRDSEIRIKEYQKRLPGLKAKVSSVAMLFAISVVMMVSASFAWVTLSANPEIEGIATTVTANGNLEIALSDPEGKLPAESMVGDSNLPLLERNLTWGNLVNLSDVAYGLDKITLRPAILRENALKDSPLYAAQYASDGRVEALYSKFSYTQFDKDNKVFIVPKSSAYGVRAISSVKYEWVGGEEAYAQALANAETALMEAQDAYKKLTESKSTHMETICKLLGVYVTDYLAGNTNATAYDAHIESIYKIMEAMQTCMDKTGDAVVEIINAREMMLFTDQAKTYENIEEVFDALDKGDLSNLKLNQVYIDVDKKVTFEQGLKKYKTNYNSFGTHLQAIDGLRGKEGVYWKDISGTVNFLVDINTALINGNTISQLVPVIKDDLFGAGKQLLNNMKVVITKGMLLDTEQFLGAYMNVEGATISFSYKGMPLSAKNAKVYTAANPDNGILSGDVNYQLSYLTEFYNELSNSGGNTSGSSAVAADTYGLAIDFWVRSNMDKDYLILEGNIRRGTKQMEDLEGNKYFTDSKGRVVIQDVDGKYFYQDGEPLPVEEESNLSITYEVIGFDGENRVWDDDDLAGQSATQGSGSCYVFYADTPEDQAQSLGVLAAMNIVFIDENGKKLASAKFDVNSYYAEMGRVTIPIKLNDDGVYVGVDENDVPIYSITELTKGEAQRITALIYIDGKELENSDVLSDGSISGKLNLQFGTNEDLIAADDTALKDAEVSILAEADKTHFGEDWVGDYKTKIDLTIDGVVPKTVTGNFIRKINSSQGTLQKEMTFLLGDNGKYSASYTFTSPGTYVLRSVWLDGIEYELSKNVEVQVDGFGIASVTWGISGNEVSLMMAENSYSVQVFATLSGGQTPSKVQGIFINEDSQQALVAFSSGGDGTWSGIARFSTSGTYRLEYLIIDGEHYEIPESSQKKITLALGVKAHIQAIPNVLEDFVSGEKRSVDLLATVEDNKGNPLSNVSLGDSVIVRYKLQGSSLQGNDLISTLEWNEKEQQYEGQIIVSKPGVYEFRHMTIFSGDANKESTLYSAEAKVIRALPKDPPQYKLNKTEEVIFAYGTSIYMQVEMENAEGIADYNPSLESQDSYIEATLVHGDITIPVKGMKSAVNNKIWQFAIPTTDALINLGYEGATSLGEWKITELKVVGAYYNDQVSTEENPMVIDLASENIVTRLDATMSVIVTSTGASTIQPTEKKLFMDSFEAKEGLKVVINGPVGESVDPNIVSDVKVVYKLDMDSVTISSGSESVGYASSNESYLRDYRVTTTLVPYTSQDGTTHYQIHDLTPLTFAFAGTYEIDHIEYTLYKGTAAELTYTTTTNPDGVNTEQNIVWADCEKAPMYRFAWDAPVTKITQAKWNTTTNKLDAYTCEAERKIKKGSTCTGPSIDYNPYVTLTLSDGGKFETAEFNLQGNQTGSQTAKYEFSKGAAVVEKELTTGTGCAGSNIPASEIFTGGYITMKGTYGGETISYVFKLNTGIEVTVNNIQS